MSDKVLVTDATAAAWTGEVAEAVGKSLCDGASTADVIRAKEMTDVSSNGALVVESAIRVGKPLAEMAPFLQAQQDALSQVAVACFLVCGALCEDADEAEAHDYDDESFRRGLPRLGCGVRSVLLGAKPIAFVVGMEPTCIHTVHGLRSAILAMKARLIRRPVADSAGELSAPPDRKRSSGSHTISRKLGFGCGPYSRGGPEQSPLAASQPLKREPAAANSVSESDGLSLRHIAEGRHWGEGNAHHAGAGMRAQH